LGADHDDLRASRGGFFDDRGAEVASSHDSGHDLHSIGIGRRTGTLEQSTSVALDTVEASVQRKRSRDLDDGDRADLGAVVGGEPARDPEGVERLDSGIERYEQPVIAAFAASSRRFLEHAVI